MIDPQAHLRTASHAVKKLSVRSRLHDPLDPKGCLIRRLLSAGRTSACIGARAWMSCIQLARLMRKGRGSKAEWFRNTLTERGIRWIEAKPWPHRLKKERNGSIASPAAFCIRSLHGLAYPAPLVWKPLSMSRSF
jgi:hypothetical protein